MADWPFSPRLDREPKITFDPPATNITKLDDGSVVTHEKNANAPRTWNEEYALTMAEWATARTFWYAHRLVVPFTKFAWDDAASSATLATVRFAGPLELSRAGEDFVRFFASFIEDF